MFPRTRRQTGPKPGRITHVSPQATGNGVQRPESPSGVPQPITHGAAVDPKSVEQLRRRVGRFPAEEREKDVPGAEPFTTGLLPQAAEDGTS